MQKYILSIVTGLALLSAVACGALYMQSRQQMAGYQAALQSMRQEFDALRAQKDTTDSIVTAQKQVVDVATKPWSTYTSPDGRVSFQYPKELFTGEKAPLSFSVISKKESEAKFAAEVADMKASGNTNVLDGACEDLGDLDCTKDEWQKSYATFQKAIAGTFQFGPFLTYERSEVPLITHATEQIHSLPFFIGLSQSIQGGPCLVDYITYTKDVRVRFTARCEDENANYLPRDEASLREANNILAGTGKSDLDKSRRNILRQMANSLNIK